ncbi:MAG TPA: hypothetical protein PLY23_08810, partial [Alphaproteobacteria bacterium]|nr:hypothetical protein [Alphaproteobacteria bacterium]HQS94698.1 hypothetical protein [Alphaproteobacteria bacterium]
MKRWGSWDAYGTLALARALSNLTNLQKLNLFNNAIGYTDSNGTISLARALHYLVNLQYLNLGLNNIGATGDEGPIALLPELVDLVQQYSLTNLSLSSMANFSWSQQANALKTLIDRGIQEACESQLCHADSHVSTQPGLHAQRRSFLPSQQGTLSITQVSKKEFSKINQDVVGEIDFSQMEEESFVTSSASSLQPPL